VIGRRPIAVLSFAQLPPVARDPAREETELVQPVVAEALDRAGLHRREIGFTVSGSCDYLIGRPFSFVSALDGVAPWPPISESHVEMDGAWAMYEAWVRLQQGDIDTALIYCYGKSSLGDLNEILTQQLDPYYLAPLGIDAVSLAALQARSLLDSGRATEHDFANIVATRTGGDAAGKLAAPYLVAPLRQHDCPAVADGACAVVLAAGDRARRATRPAWIRGIDHRIEPHQLGSRDLTRSESTRIAAAHAGLAEAGPIDVAELHAPFSYQELILRDALQLDDRVVINRSGGALAANPLMVAGLTRIGEAAAQIHAGTARRAVAHATSGPCLQQNLVCVLAAEASP
jgi:acetyl-CoA acetyltransferase